MLVCHLGWNRFLIYIIEFCQHLELMLAEERRPVWLRICDSRLVWDTRDTNRICNRMLQFNHEPTLSMRKQFSKLSHVRNESKRNTPRFAMPVDIPTKDRQQRSGSSKASRQCLRNSTTGLQRLTIRKAASICPSAHGTSNQMRPFITRIRTI